MARKTGNLESHMRLSGRVPLIPEETINIGQPIRKSTPILNPSIPKTRVSFHQEEKYVYVNTHA